jgi:hypothetical protein
MSVRLSRGTVAIVAAATIVLVVTATFVASRGRAPAYSTAQEQATPSRGRDLGLIGPAFGSDPGSPYPSEWAVPVVALEERVKFDVYLPPSDSALSPSSAFGAFASPGGEMIALDYAAIDESGTVRQEYLEVYEADWDAPESPTEAFEADLKNAPADGQELIRLVDGSTALVVSPNSEDDVEAANPAYIEFVIGTTDIQLSGGADLDLLVDIANRMVEAPGQEA